MKFQPKDTYAPELSPNREAMKSLNEARSEAAAEVAELQGRLRRLDDLKSAIPPLEAEVAALDAAEAAALAEWSASPDAPAPVPDVAARADILGRLTAARQRVTTAEQATASVEHVLATANTRAAGLEHQAPALVAAVLIDEAKSLLPGLLEAAAALAKVQSRFSALRTFLLERAEAAKDVAMRNGFFQALEALDRDAAEAARVAPLISFNPGAEWREMADALGDTQHRPTPALPAAFGNMPELPKW